MSYKDIPTWDEIRGILKELSVNQKELKASQKETDRQIKELRASQKETDRQIKELRTSQKETDRQIRERSKETDRQIRETDRQIQKVGSRFNERWGRFVESLVEGKLLELLRAWRIRVEQIFSNAKVSMKKKDGSVQSREFDIIAVNGTEVTALEVKTVLTPKKVNHFIEILKDFKSYFPDYKDKKLYAAVAFLKSEDKAEDFAEKKGLFVIRATGDSAKIINKKSFKPKIFA